MVRDRLARQNLYRRADDQPDIAAPSEHLGAVIPEIATETFLLGADLLSSSPGLTKGSSRRSHLTQRYSAQLEVGVATKQPDSIRVGLRALRSLA